MNVPIGKFKAELSRYIRAATNGNEVVVTSRGRPLVRVVPVVAEQADRPLTREELRAKIKRLMPEVRIGKGKFKLSPPIITIRPGEKTMSELVIEGRR